MFTKKLLDTIFPIQCLCGCKQWDKYICTSSLNKISQQKKLLVTNNNLAGLYYLADYANNLIQDIIHQFKYQYAEEISQQLGQNLAACLDQHFDYIIPIPLHEKRLAERGFNQAELLAQSINNILPNIKIEKEILIRKKYTKPQAQIKDKLLRKNNMQNAFMINKIEINSALGGCALGAKKIILIDDVYTTGATMNACAKLLKNNGAECVWGLVIAKG